MKQDENTPSILAFGSTFKCMHDKENKQNGKSGKEKHLCLTRRSVESDGRAVCSEEGDVGWLTSETPEQDASWMCQSQPLMEYLAPFSHAEARGHAHRYLYTQILQLDGQASITRVAASLPRQRWQISRNLLGRADCFLFKRGLFLLGKSLASMNIV